MKQRIIQVLLFATSCAALTACSLQNKSSQMTTVEINLPSQHPANASQLENPADFNSVLQAMAPSSRPDRPVAFNQQPPTAFSQFNCYAVNISGGTIPPAGGTSCPNTAPGQYIGVYGGMYTAGPQTVSLSVPNGSGIEIQLMGFVSANGGCPALQSIFSGTGNVPGMNGPWLLASTTVDISTNVTVDLTASYNPVGAQQLYQNCSIGTEASAAPPTVAFTGSVSGGGGSSGAPALTLNSDSSPTGLPANTGTLTGPIPMPSPSLASLPRSCSNDCENNPPQVTGAVSATSTTGRAAIQFAWDLTTASTALSGYGNFSLYFRGGQADSCATGQAYGATAGVWDSNESKWFAIGSGTYMNGNGGSGDTILKWFSGSSPIGVPLSDLAITGGTDQYVVVNVESNYTGNASCPSAVYVSSAGFAAANSVAGEINNSNQLYVYSNAVQGSNGGIIGGNSQPVLFAAQGGTPPYTYSSLNGGTFDADGNGIYVAPGTPSDIVTVTDAASDTQSIPVTLVTGTTPVGAVMTLDSTSIGSLSPNPNGDGSYTVTAGTCLDFDADFVSYAGATISTPSFTGISFMNPNGGGSPIQAYSSNSCTTAYTPTSFTSNPTASIYAMPTQAGFFQIAPGWTGGSSSNNIVNSSSAVLYVTPGAYYGVTMIAPAVMSESECIPVTIQEADQYGNPNPIASTVPAGSVTVTPLGFNVIGTNGALYASSDTGCSAPLDSITVSAGQSAQYNFMDSSINSFNGGVALGTASTSSGPFFAPQTTPSGSTVYQTESPTQAVAIQVSLVPAAVSTDGLNPDTSGCLGITVGTVTSNGTPEPPSITASIQLSFPGTGGGTAYGSQGDCETSTPDGASSSVTINTASTTTLWVPGMSNSMTSSNFIGATQSSGPTPALLPAKLTL